MSRTIVVGLITIVIIFGIVLIYNNYVFSRTGSVVTLVDKKEDQIIVQFENNDRETIKVPSIITPLLDVGEDYFIVYYENYLRGPFLKKIEH